MYIIYITSYPPTCDLGVALRGLRSHRFAVLFGLFTAACSFLLRSLIHIYIYLYLYLSLSLSLYIYIYINCMYIYIYI